MRRDAACADWKSHPFLPKPLLSGNYCNILILFERGLCGGKLIITPERKCHAVVKSTGSGGGRLSGFASWLGHLLLVGSSPGLRPGFFISTEGTVLVPFM